MIGTTAAISFSLLLILVLTGGADIIDDPIRQFFYDLRRDWLTPIVKAVTYLGNWQAITILCLLLLLFQKTRMTYGIPLSVGAIFVTILNKAIKSLVARPRPDTALHLIHQGGWSFPSGHSITSMFFFGMLICLIRDNVQNRKLSDILTVLLALPMIGIGLSRIYLGVHYPTDVLAGWCLGIIVILILQDLCQRIRSWRS